MINFVENSVSYYVMLGAWPTDEAPTFEVRCRYVFGLFLAALFAICVLFEWIDMYHQWGNWMNLSESGSFCTAITVVFIKMCLSYYRRPEMTRLVEEMDSYVDDIITEGDEKKMELLAMHERRIKLINKIYRYGAMTCVHFLVVWPFVALFNGADRSSRLLVYPMYCPFSLEPPGNYAIPLVAQIIIAYFLVWHVLAFDMFFIGCITFAIGRLRIFQYSLEKLGRRTGEGSVSTSLKEHIDEHRKIIEFINVIDSVLSPVLFVVFFVYVTVFCALGFGAMVSTLEVGVNLDLARSAVYMQIEIMQAFIYYWHGNEFTLQSVKVSQAAFSGKWYDLPTSDWKVLNLLIRRSQTPVFLTAGKLGPVSLAAFLTILKHGYSFFAVMKNAYRRKV